MADLMERIGGWNGLEEATLRITQGNEDPYTVSEELISRLGK
jgi:hypothetical protein